MLIVTQISTTDEVYLRPPALLIVIKLFTAVAR
uniref:Uncharacterized protein n=1 Tax=Anguilla anguilla TaxID=7936 RepID=A0A0E9SKE6_ANGAN